MGELAGTGHVRSFTGGPGIISALSVSFVAKHLFLREKLYTPPFMLELPAYKLPSVRSVAIGLYNPRQDVPAAGRDPRFFFMMVVIWFLASFSRGLRKGAEGAGDQLQPRRDDRRCASAGFWRPSDSTGRSASR